ncbi:hypothetical protein [Clostridium massiliodielmoense]|uniref:hypothetical protein n=1 Tax=Clostridium massiliodielmoense TaxID=1776385 RepID=UPI000A26E2C1|nr:hypothetical protein [Clostridium massiliodielmoense]
MKLEVNYRLLRIVLVTLVIMGAITLNVKVFGRGEIVHKFRIKNDIYVDKDQEFNYNILDIGGDVYIDGRSIGNIAVINSDVHVNGDIQGNIICLFGKIYRGQNSRIMGKTMEISSSNKQYLMNDNGIFNKNNIWYIIFGLVCLESLYIINAKERMKVAKNMENNLKKKFKYGYIIEFSCFVLLLILSFALLGLQFSPAIALIPLISLGGFLMYLLGSISLIVYFGMKINSKLNIKIPYLLYIAIAVILCSFIRNIKYFGIVFQVFLINPLAMGAIYVEYLHNCLNKLNYEDNKIKSQ